MSISWADYRSQYLSALLVETGEESDALRWPETLLRTAVWAALAEFAQHTAAATATGYDEADDLEYELPDNVLSGDSFDATALVYYNNGTRDIFYSPIEFIPGLTTRNIERGFYTYPHNTTLIVTTAPGADYTLNVRYFAHYNKPYGDDDLITVPEWGLMPLAYLTGIHAISNHGLRQSFTKNWLSKTDSGTPLMNAVTEQQKIWRRMYDTMMLDRAPQKRFNSWRGD